MHTLDIIHLNDMLMYGVVKIWLFPGQADLTGCDLLESYFRRRRDVQAQFLHQYVIGGLADLPSTIQKPLQKRKRQPPNKPEQRRRPYQIRAQKIETARNRAMTPLTLTRGMMVG